MGVTLLFPGQGSQYVGMGKMLQDFPECKDIFHTADRVLGFSLSDMCFNGPEELLSLTENTQPAILTHSIALFTKLKTALAQKNFKIDRVLGHSVGEYAALVAAGAIRFEDALVAVKNRGRFMQEAVPPGKGKMIAILRVPGNIVGQACEEVSTSDSKVMPANFNEPGQAVISGHAEACDRAVKWLADNYEGKQMAIPLKVSAPFHCTLMRPAEENLSRFLATIEFKENDIPYIANINAHEFAAGTSSVTIKNNLIEQVCSSVLWYQSMGKVPTDSLCIEVGPGKVLTGLNKKINKDLKTYTLDEGFEKLEEFLA